jgi:hypothetical protein
MSFCERSRTSNVISMHVEHSVIPVIWKLNVSVWPAVIVTSGFLALTVSTLVSLLLIVVCLNICLSLSHQSLACTVGTVMFHLFGKPWCREVTVTWCLRIICSVTPGKNFHMQHYFAVKLLARLLSDHEVISIDITCLNSVPSIVLNSSKQRY